MALNSTRSTLEDGGLVFDVVSFLLEVHLSLAGLKWLSFVLLSSSVFSFWAQLLPFWLSLALSCGLFGLLAIALVFGFVAFVLLPLRVDAFFLFWCLCHSLLSVAASRTTNLTQN